MYIRFVGAFNSMIEKIDRETKDFYFCDDLKVRKSNMKLLNSTKGYLLWIRSCVLLSDDQYEDEIAELTRQQDIRVYQSLIQGNLYMVNDLDLLKKINRMVDKHIDATYPTITDQE